MAKYKFVGPTSAREQIFITKYEKNKDTQMLTMIEGVEYELNSAQIDMLPKNEDGTINQMFKEVLPEEPQEPEEPELPGDDGVTE